MVVYVIRNYFKILYICTEQLCDMIRVGQTDLLPHFRRGGGDSCDILETACGDHFHHAVLRVAAFYQID